MIARVQSIAARKVIDDIAAQIKRKTLVYSRERENFKPFWRATLKILPTVTHLFKLKNKNWFYLHYYSKTGLSAHMETPAKFFLFVFLNFCLFVLTLVSLQKQVCRATLNILSSVCCCRPPTLKL